MAIGYRLSCKLKDSGLFFWLACAILNVIQGVTKKDCKRRNVALHESLKVVILRHTRVCRYGAYYLDSHSIRAVCSVSEMRLF